MHIRNLAKIMFAVCLLPTVSNAEAIVVRAGKMLDVVSGKILENQQIVIEHGKIAEIRDDDGANTSGWEVLDLSSRFVLPGVMDMHTHLIGSWKQIFSPACSGHHTAR